MKLTSRAIFPVALLLSSTSAFAQSGPWTVSETRGEVVIKTADGERAARRGARIAAGEQVVTGNRGTATIVRGREFVTVRPNSRISIAPRERERGVIQIIQDFGSALFNIGRQPDPHFGVDTPYLAAVVKGTTFSITVSEEGASMQVTEGAVEASTFDGGARDLVRPGEIAVIAADDLYRLNIEGDVPRQLDSPNRGVSTPTPSASATPAASASASAGGVTNTLSDNGAAGPQAAIITSAVGSSAASVSDLTDGLVSGEVEAAIEPAVALQTDADIESAEVAADIVAQADQGEADVFASNEVESPVASDDQDDIEKSSEDDEPVVEEESSDDDIASEDEAKIEPAPEPEPEPEPEPDP